MPLYEESDTSYECSLKLALSLYIYTTPKPPQNSQFDPTVCTNVSVCEWESERPVYLLGMYLCGKPVCMMNMLDIGKPSR